MGPSVGKGLIHHQFGQLGITVYMMQLSLVDFELSLSLEVDQTSFTKTQRSIRSHVLPMEVQIDSQSRVSERSVVPKHPKSSKSSKNPKNNPS